MPEVAPPSGPLARHDLRRASSIPTVSVLVGPVSLGLQTWSHWLRETGRRGIQLDQPSLTAVVARWTESVAGSTDLFERAVDYLARCLGSPPAEVKARLASKTLHDLEQFWETVPVDRHRDASAGVCHYMTRQRLMRNTLDPSQLADLLTTAIPGPDAGQRVMKALAGLLPTNDLPAILLIQPRGERSAWLSAAGNLVGGLVTAVPSLVAGLAVEEAVWRAYLETAPESRNLALLREGHVPLVSLQEPAIAEQCRQAGADPAPLTSAIRELAEIGAGEELVQSFAETAQQVQQSAGDDDELGRSAAERFLFELLDSLPETTGRFELNGTLDFRFGPADAEVDILARREMLAIEVDGYYHFRDADGYRRDRRKDWELQRRGFLVLRFLADDVVARLEEIRETILAAIAHRSEANPERATT